MTKISLLLSIISQALTGLQELLEYIVKKILYEVVTNSFYQVNSAVYFCKSSQVFVTNKNI